MNFNNIVVSVEESIASLSLNRPEIGNALRVETMAEICEAMDFLEKDSNTSVIVLRAEGKHFCVGAEFSFLDDLARMPATDIQRQIYQYFQGAARRLYHCPKPTIALVSGAAVTVGCELALACDFRIASETARFQESWIKLGLMPPLGGLFLLPRIIGLGRAKNMVLRAEAMTAASALDAGLVTEVVPRDHLDARGIELAKELAGLPPLAYAAIKQACHRGLETSMEAEWSSNVVNQAVLLGSNDFREGLNAVKDKRHPHFTGS